MLKSLIFYDKITKSLISEEIQKSIIKSGLEKKINNKIEFYVINKKYKIEDLKKIIKKNNYKLIAFYSLLQFCYEHKTKIDLIRELSKRKCQLFFAREKLLIKNNKEFEKNYYNLIIFPITNNKLIRVILEKLKSKTS